VAEDQQVLAVVAVTVIQQLVQIQDQAVVEVMEAQHEVETAQQVL
jgi:hypothetical protein